MKKSELDARIRLNAQNKISVLSAELAQCKDDNTINGLLKRANLMMRIADLMEIFA